MELAHHLESFLKCLGYPALHIHPAVNHFDFLRPARRILVIGPMGSGKTEYSARVWRDSKVARQKRAAMTVAATTSGADRRQVFFIRSALDRARFPDLPTGALPYRGGYEDVGPNIAEVRDSFDLEKVIAAHPQVGTWVIDEAAFYDERLSYVMRRAGRKKSKWFTAGWMRSAGNPRHLRKLSRWWASSMVCSYSWDRTRTDFHLFWKRLS